MRSMKPPKKDSSGKAEASSPDAKRKWQTAILLTTRLARINAGIDNNLIVFKTLFTTIGQHLMYSDQHIWLIWKLWLNRRDPSDLHSQLPHYQQLREKCHSVALRLRRILKGHLRQICSLPNYKKSLKRLVQTSLLEVSVGKEAYLTSAHKSRQANQLINLSFYLWHIQEQWIILRLQLEGSWLCFWSHRQAVQIFNTLLLWRYILT